MLFKHFIKDRQKRSSQKGVALILVIFIVTLASVLVIDLAYSTYIGGRINASVERSLQAEYLLKSALNLARVLIMSDTSAEDSPNDAWTLFKNGMTIPPEIIGITEENLSVELEIRSEGSKIPLRQLVPATISIAAKWRMALARLMETELKFDEDGEEDQSPYFVDQHRKFNSKQLVANLIDYQSETKQSFEQGDFKGIKGELPENSFPGVPISNTSELAAIPGFTPLRVQRLIPFVSASPASSRGKVNINLAPLAIIKALDEGITDQAATDIDAFRNDTERGPFKDGELLNQLKDILPEDVAERLPPLLSCSSNAFQVVAKVDYGTSSYFLRAYLSKSSGPGAALPEIKSLELF